MKPSDSAVHCEAVKVSLMQTKDGVKITFVIHPSEIPSSMFTDPVGTRYMLAAAKIGDDEQAVVPEEKIEGDRLVTSAALMCKEPEFWSWLVECGYTGVHDEESASDALRTALSISSRGELATDQWAQRRFKEMRHNYMNGVV